MGTRVSMKVLLCMMIIACMMMFLAYARPLNMAESSVDRESMKVSFFTNMNTLGGIKDTGPSPGAGHGAIAKVHKWYNKFVHYNLLFVFVFFFLNCNMSIDIYIIVVVWPCTWDFIKRNKLFINFGINFTDFIYIITWTFRRETLKCKVYS